MNKLLAFLTGSLLLISYLQPAKGQADDCNSTRIAVKVNSMVLQQIIYDVTLTAQYGSRTKEEWKGFVEQMVADVPAPPPSLSQPSPRVAGVGSERWRCLS